VFWGGDVDLTDDFFFFLFFLASAVAAAGPLEIVIQATVEVFLGRL